MFGEVGGTGTGCHPVGGIGRCSVVSFHLGSLFADDGDVRIHLFVLQREILGASERVGSFGVAGVAEIAHGGPHLHVMKEPLSLAQVFD